MRVLVNRGMEEMIAASVMLRLKARYQHERREEQRGREAVEALQRSGSARYIPHTPHPKQALFLSRQELEALYGGAAGGGKSDALLMAALQYVHVPGYAAIIFRRSLADLALPGALIPRSHEWLSGTDARWREQDKTWTFPSGATLTFGYLDNENDKYRYQSTEFQFVGFDELTQFTETQYTYMFSRLRRLEGSNVPLRSRSASNPGGVGHEWVKKRFVTEGEANGRPFIPAALADNPSLDQDEYVTSLNQLDYVTRMQLLHGDWSVGVAGGLFDRTWWKRYRREDVAFDYQQGKLRGARFVDTAQAQNQGSDYTVIATWLTDGVRGYLWDLKRGKWTFPEQMRQLQNADEMARGLPTYIEYTPWTDALIVSLQAVIPGVVPWKINDRARYSERSKQERAKGASPFAEAGNLYLPYEEKHLGWEVCSQAGHAHWLDEFVEEHHVFPKQGIHDDQVDTTSMFAITMLAGQQVTIGSYA